MSIKELYEKYLLLNLKDFPNIGIDLEINKILLALTLGLIVAALLINYHRSYMHLTVKKLLRHSAIDEKSAKTLSELGISSGAVRLALSRTGQLTKIVRRVGEPTYTYEEYVAKTKTRGYKEGKINFDEAQFYIDENHLDRARQINEAGDTSIFKSILFCLLILTVSGCIFLLMPEILTGVNNLLTP